MPLPNPPLTKTKLLVVEGPDDLRFLRALLRQLGIESEFDIRSSEGVTNLSLFLQTLRGISGFAQVVSLGVVRDADQSKTSAFQSACTALRKGNFSVPQQPLTITEITGDSPSVSIFLWPDCQADGTLETLCLNSVQNDPAMPCIDQYFDCLRDLPKSIHKARLHAFLASRERPGLRLGEASEKGYWPWDHQVFDPIKQFLRSL